MIEIDSNEQAGDFFNQVQQLPARLSQYPKAPNSENGRWYASYELGSLPDELIRDRDTVRLMLAVLPEIKENQLDDEITAVETRNKESSMTARLFHEGPFSRENDNDAIEIARKNLKILLRQCEASEIAQKLRKIEKEIDNMAA